MSRLPISAAIAAALLAVALSPPPCFAQCDRTMANTSKEGSLPIWPLVKVGTADTIVKLNNEYSKGVKVRCVYRIPVWSRLNGAAGGGRPRRFRLRQGDLGPGVHPLAPPGPYYQ